MIGESRVAEQLDKALTRAERTLEKELDADADELQKRARRRREGRDGAVSRPAS